MRFASICTLFVVVLTLAIHNVSASPVEQGDQVNQGQNDLSKRADATCTFVDHPNFTKVQQDNLHKFLTNIVGSNVGCQVTNFATKLSATKNSCQVPAMKTELSAVLDSLKTFAKTPRPHAGFPNNKEANKYARVSRDEYNMLKRWLPHAFDRDSYEIFKGLVQAISFPSPFFNQFPSIDSFYLATCH